MARNILRIFTSARAVRLFLVVLGYWYVAKEKESEGQEKKKHNKEKWLYCIYPQGFPGKILIFTVVWKTRLAQQNINFYGYNFF